MLKRLLKWVIPALTIPIDLSKSTSFLEQLRWCFILLLLFLCRDHHGFWKAKLTAEQILIHDHVVTTTGATTSACMIDIEVVIQKLWGRSLKALLLLYMRVINAAIIGKRRLCDDWFDLECCKLMLLYAWWINKLLLHIIFLMFAMTGTVCYCHNQWLSPCHLVLPRIYVIWPEVSNFKL